MIETHESGLREALARVTAEGTYSACLAAHHALEKLREAGTVPTMRLGVLRNFTIEPLLPVLDAEAARDGSLPVTYLGDFDAIAADALDSTGPLARFHPSVIVLALWLTPLAPRLVERFPSLSADEVQAEVTRVVTYVRDMLAGLRRWTRAPILLNNFPLPPRRALGILDAQREESQTEAALGLNRALRQLATDAGSTFIVDYMSVFAAVGSAEGLDARNWAHRRSPLGRPVLLPLGQEYARYFRALRGGARKCVVVDCDNTLWGGIVGEDGPDGIRIGDGPGATHTSLQRELLNLHDRGVLIALCSKNNEEDVLEVLRTHPDMLLRESHVACHRINWDDKASNLQAIAQTLNIGLDSVVFVDDSVFECGLVRDRLPDVVVVELTSAGSDDYGSQLARRGLFDSLVSSTEDAQRTSHFKAEVTRRELQSTAGSLEDFLRGLEMVAEVGEAHDEVIARIAQLTQKTNQFNLTTRRYTEADIRRFAGAGSSAVLYLRLRDAVADLGLVGVAIVTTAGRIADVDTFLLSCRALGRGVEAVLLDEVRRCAEARGCTTLRGRYVPTPKNAQVAEFFPSAGFAIEAAGPTPSFVAELTTLPCPTSPIAVVRIPSPRSEPHDHI